MLEHFDLAQAHFRLFLSLVCPHIAAALRLHPVTFLNLYDHSYRILLLFENFFHTYLYRERLHRNVQKLNEFTQERYLCRLKDHSFFLFPSPIAFFHL